jgi:diacylglycerol kinase (ATP)
MHRKLLIIVNPKAGKGKYQEVVDRIKNGALGTERYEIALWKNKDEFGEIEGRLRNGGFTDAVAVGGDGTVNMVARAILGTDITLGIIPSGSGNGLARTLGISTNIGRALKEIQTGRTIAIDHGSINGLPFFCTAGMGFDSHIGDLFARSVKRGLRNYVRIILREMLRYKSQEYVIKSGNEQINRQAFLITVANAGQYGNDFYIAPQASMQDGLFHVAILRPFGLTGAVRLFSSIVRKRAHLNSLIETFTSDGLSITRKSDGLIHFDGEPAITGAEVHFRMHRSALKVIAGEKFRSV